MLVTRYAFEQGRRAQRRSRYDNLLCKEAIGFSAMAILTLVLAREFARKPE